jgi:hypothetical protein
VEIHCVIEDQSLAIDKDARDQVNRSLQCVAERGAFDAPEHEMHVSTPCVSGIGDSGECPLSEI